MQDNVKLLLQKTTIDTDKVVTYFLKYGVSFIIVIEKRYNGFNYKAMTTIEERSLFKDFLPNLNTYCAVARTPNRALNALLDCIVKELKDINHMYVKVPELETIL